MINFNKMLTVTLHNEQTGQNVHTVLTVFQLVAQIVPDG
jgi:hypothetical protein